MKSVHIAIIMVASLGLGGALIFTHKADAELVLTVNAVLAFILVFFGRVMSKE